MRKLLILLCLLLIILMSFFVAGYYVLFDYSFIDTHTKAICSGNICQDYEFTCLGGEELSSRAISGYVVFDSEWVDSRKEKNTC